MVAAEGATPVWFEEFGGRDADPEEAYLTEVDYSSIYLAILKERYGRQLRSGYSATHAEYNRAHEGGKRISIWIASPAPERDGHLVRFIDDLRVFHVTGRFSGPEDLAERVRRRLHELAAEALSPWVKLDELVFRADEIHDTGRAIRIVARANDEIGRRLAALRDQQWARPRVALAYGERVVQGELAELGRSVRAAGSAETTIELGGVEPRRVESLRAGTSGFSPDDLVELGLRNLFLGEPLPPSLGVLSGMTNPGIDHDALREAFALPDGIAEPVTRLIISEGLVSHGHAAAVTRLELGPRVGEGRRIDLEWEEPRVYANVTPGRRRLAGLWRV